MKRAPSQELGMFAAQVSARTTLDNVCCKKTSSLEIMASATLHATSQTRESFLMYLTPNVDTGMA